MRIECDELLEVLGLGGGVGEPFRRHSRDPLVQARVFGLGMAAKRAQPMVAQRRPTLEPLEQPLAVPTGIGNHLGDRALGSELTEDRERLLGTIEPLFEQECALER